MTSSAKRCCNEAHADCSGELVDSIRFQQTALSPARRDHQLVADVVCYLDGVVINKVSYAVMRDAAEFRPCAKRANRRLLARREYSALAQADNVRKLISEKR